MHKHFRDHIGPPPYETPVVLDAMQQLENFGTTSWQDKQYRDLLKVILLLIDLCVVVEGARNLYGFQPPAMTAEQLRRLLPLLEQLRCDLIDYRDLARYQDVTVLLQAL